MRVWPGCLQILSQESSVRADTLVRCMALTGRTVAELFRLLLGDIEGFNFVHQMSGTGTEDPLAWIASVTGLG